MTDKQPKALEMAQVLDDTHQHPKIAGELRRLHAENEALRESLKTEELISFRRQMQGYAAQVEVYEALLQQVLNDICGAKLCEVNSMSSRAEARRLLDKATDAIRARLGETT